ncbi:f2970ee8-797b-43f3-bd36-efbb454f2ca5 [Sclerotinia trifoliorum]|uniref:F2970ee8-797b-43f3-bd36-efbb454f2ca5 n=1 Tax=Sclerotinia trifoliorum TaxID=28548 RepID=A0A8H2ZXB0_9HELO|nr:f2970ee8-797b-43f3-bd36-efbb454f2ca5 [Sclerotinia trifoliorum]
MSQDTSAGMVNHPVNTSDEAKNDSLHDTSEREVTTDTKQGIEVTAAKMNLESSTAQLLSNLSVSSSKEQELKAPDNPSQSNTAFHKSSDVDNEPKSIIDTATAGEDGRKVNAENTNSVAPPMSIVRPLENINPATENQPPTNTTTTTETTISPNTQQHCQPSITSIFTNPQTLSDNPTIANPATNLNKEMNVVKSRTTRRKMARVKAHPNALTIYEAELTSKDRATQKEAVRQYLEKNVKEDWNWVWPAEESDPIDIMEALVKNASLDEAHNTSMDSTTYKEEWRERDIWESDPSESESEDPISPKGPININSPDKESPFRFDSPDSVGRMVKQRRAARRRRHKKKLGAEMEWNTGVHCYVERRDAWTCARRVPPPEPRGIENTPVHTNGNPHQAVDDFSDSEGWETEVPIAKPLLPPDNAMRASINPQAYSTIYDKVIIQSLTPSCPINLSDVIQSCVHGWKRDGEWPPSSSVPEPSLAGKKKQRRLSMLSILGLNPPETKAPIPVAEKSPQTPNSIKKGLQKLWKRGDKVRAAPEGGAGA